MVFGTTAQSTLPAPAATPARCEQVMTRALTLVAGVTRVRVDLPKREVRVAYDPVRIDRNRVATILVEEEYPVAVVAPTDDDSNG